MRPVKSCIEMAKRFYGTDILISRVIQGPIDYTTSQSSTSSTDKIRLRAAIMPEVSSRKFIKRRGGTDFKNDLTILVKVLDLKGLEIDENCIVEYKSKDYNVKSWEDYTEGGAIVVYLVRRE